MKKALILLIPGLLAGLFLADKPVELGPGVMAPDPPRQTEPSHRDVRLREGYRITPLADFATTSKILSKETYRLGREADLSPIDLALGWGPMSDERILTNFEISQSGRWYFWRATTLPISSREVARHSANMHVIPADDRIEEALSEVSVGEIVHLEGQLVRVDADDGWRWISSISRDDTGARSCELFLVESLRSVAR